LLFYKATNDIAKRRFYGSIAAAQILRTVTVALSVVGLLIVTGDRALASMPDITAGLSEVSAGDLAGKILTIAIGAAALSGVVAAAVLTYLGFKLKTGGERDRAETKEHIMWVFLGLGLAGFAAVIAGFAAYMVRGA